MGDDDPQPALPKQPPKGPRLIIVGVPDAKKISPGGPVRLNDDHDCGKFFTSALASSLAPGAPTLHELEPVLDMHLLQDTPLEDDLVEIKLELVPPNQAGTVELRAVSAGGKRIRLWPKRTKGAARDIVTLPKTFAPSDLPKTFFVEGVETGIVGLEAQLTPPKTSATSSPVDTVTLNVVRLQVDQRKRNHRMIYLASEEIFLRVAGAGPSYTFEWDLDGDGTFEITTPMAGLDPNVVKVTYGGGPNLPRNAANTRKVFDVGVRINGSFVLRARDGVTTGGAGHPQVGTSGIRVALDSHQGSPLPPKTSAGVQSIFSPSWSDTFPVKFSPPMKTSAAPNRFSGPDRIQFNPTMTSNDGAETQFFPDPGPKRVVVGVTVGPRIFDSGQVREDLIASVNHEVKHLKQHVAVRDNDPPNNVWRLLDDNFGNVAGYVNFREAEGHLSELLESGISWRHLTSEGQNDMQAFATHWRECLKILPGLPEPARSAARKLMQDMYKSIPFFEMKRHRDVVGTTDHYADSVRAPE